MWAVSEFCARTSIAPEQAQRHNSPPSRAFSYKKQAQLQIDISIPYFLKKEKSMRTIQLTVPDNLDLKDHEVSMIVATKLYQDAKLSAGQAAAMVGLSKRAFIEMLGKYGVSVFSSSISDLHSDIANA